MKNKLRIVYVLLIITILQLVIPNSYDVTANSEVVKEIQINDNYL